MRASDLPCGSVKTRTPLAPGMATGWSGNDKGKPKEPRKVLGGRRKPGGVVVRKPKPGATAKPPR